MGGRRRRVGARRRGPCEGRDWHGPGDHGAQAPGAADRRGAGQAESDPECDTRSVVRGGPGWAVHGVPLAARRSADRASRGLPGQDHHRDPSARRSDGVHGGIAGSQAQGHSTGKQLELPLPSGPAWFELSVSRKTEPLGEQPHFIILSRDITERKRAEQSIHRLAYFDTLTGLANRQPFPVT